MDSYGNYVGSTPLEVVKPSSLVSVNDIFVGLECERETNRIKSYALFTTEYITIKNDGSLRNNGKEYIFSRPLYGKQIVKALMELRNLWLIYDTSHSYRTSDHIHINIQDFNQEQVNTLILNSLAMEETLFNLNILKWNRKNNPYCTPVNKYLEESNNHYTRKLFSTESFYFSRLPKYLGFRLTEYGSIEYRMFESTDSVLTLLNRINICLELVNASKNLLRLNDNLSNIKLLFPTTNKLISSKLVYPKNKYEECVGEISPELNKMLVKYSVPSQQDF